MNCKEFHFTNKGHSIQNGIEPSQLSNRWESSSKVLTQTLVINCDALYRCDIAHDTSECEVTLRRKVFNKKAQKKLLLHKNQQCLDIDVWCAFFQNGCLILMAKNTSTKVRFSKMKKIEKRNQTTR